MYDSLNSLVKLLSSTPSGISGRRLYETIYNLEETPANMALPLKEVVNAYLPNDIRQPTITSQEDLNKRVEQARDALSNLYRLIEPIIDHIYTSLNCKTRKCAELREVINKRWSKVKNTVNNYVESRKKDIEYRLKESGRI